MPKRGPKTKTALNSRAKPAAKRGPRGIATPEHLTGEARDEYLRLAAMLRKSGNLARTDPRLIELYAINYALVLEAKREIERDGLTLSTDRGKILAHPMIAVVNAATIRLRGIILDLGLCPSSPSRSIATGDSKAKENDPWAGLLNVTG